MKLSEIPDTEIDVLIAFMKERGIQGMAFGSHSISLQDYIAPETPVPLLNSDIVDDLPKLECGHEVFEANDAGQCLHGCVLPVPSTDTTGVG